MKSEQNTEVAKREPRRRMPLYRQPIFIIILVLIIVGVACCILLATRQNVTDESSESEVAEVETEEPPAPVMESEDDTGDKQVVQYEGEDPNDLEEITGSVTRASVEGEKVVISTMIDQYMVGGGDCELTLTSDGLGDAYTAGVDAIPDITVSYCEDFIVPTAELEPGKYQIKIVVTGENKKGTIESEVTI